MSNPVSLDYSLESYQKVSRFSLYPFLQPYDDLMSFEILSLSL